jgi:hypothetical protein
MPRCEGSVRPLVGEPEKRQVSGGFAICSASASDKGGSATDSKITFPATMVIMLLMILL